MTLQEYEDLTREIGGWNFAMALTDSSYEIRKAAQLALDENVDLSMDYTYNRWFKDFKNTEEFIQYIYSPSVPVRLAAEKRMKELG